MSTKIDIVPVFKLLNKDFFIPSYQRGYRWTKQEIEELLDDLYEYNSSAQNNILNIINNQSSYYATSAFYCLQPLVVKQKVEDGSYEVIDGQQRLTTIFLILSYLAESDPRLKQQLDSKGKLYSLRYESRPKSTLFFENKLYKTLSESNPDYYYISNGYKYIEDWFKKFESSNTNEGNKVIDPKVKENIFDVLMGSGPFKLNTCFIWYESEEKSTDLFTNLNEGKIPLTDSELIKALILKSDQYKINDRLPKDIENQLSVMSKEWENYTSLLNDDNFWFFINHENLKHSKRMEFIFEILSNGWELPSKDLKQKHAIFISFNNHLNHVIKEIDNKNCTNSYLEAISEIWLKVQELIERLKEWYYDNELYHLIGYVIQQNISSIAKLNKQYQKYIDNHKAKDVFIKYVRYLIGKNLKEMCDNLKIPILKDALSALSYTDNSHLKYMRKVLLLFNIDSMLTFNDDSSRFPFTNIGDKELKSLEHIHPQNPQHLEDNDEKAKDWLSYNVKAFESMLGFLDADEQFTCNQFIKEGYDILKQTESGWTKDDKEQFKLLYEKMYAFYNSLTLKGDSEDGDYQDSLFNMALVDGPTNSAFNDSFFDGKRIKLKNRLEEQDISKKSYIPICTRRVFSKYYSKKPNNLAFWNISDRIDYFDAIVSVIQKYADFYSKYSSLFKEDEEDKNGRN